MSFPVSLKGVVTLGLFCAALILAGFDSRATAASRGDIDPVSGKPCARCHLSKIDGVNVHEPVKSDCAACHRTAGGDHRELPGLFGVKTPGPRLCEECHGDMTSQKSVHKPIREGSCLGCHAPHNSPLKKLLRYEGTRLCFSCHSRLVIATWPYPHKPVAAGDCTGCHTPHQSQAPKLLKSDKQLVCFNCHNPALVKGESVHKPVAEGNCGGCHDVHGANYPKLLKLPGTPAALLCSRCHGNLASQKTVHSPVREGKCLACHSVHSAPAKKLLAKSGSEFCFQCHDKTPFSGKRFPHEPVASGACLECHDPHQATAPKLVRKTNDGQLICFSCHDKTIASGASVHGPVAGGDCGACHTVHGGDQPRLLKASITPPVKLCQECHGTMATEKSVHWHVKQGECLACHQPHSAPAKKLLMATGEKLCFECHRKERLLGAFPHSPAAAGDCMACHDPHQAKEAALIKLTDKPVCFSCHDKAMATGVSVHPPVAAGECNGCHAMHGSDQPKLLKARLAPGLTLAFSTEQFELCFTCHDVAAMTTPDTDKATAFRDGSKNLHYAHVQNGMVACRSCHDFHAAPQPHLLKEKEGSGKKTVTLAFKPTANGGNCTMSCHDSIAYDRKR